MKKIFAAVLVLAMAFVFTGCSLGGNGTKTDNTKKAEKEKIKGNCTVFECIKEIEVTDSVEEVNKKIGFDGEKTKEEEYYDIYTWKVSKSSYVEIQFNKNSKSNIKIEFDKESIANDKIDLSKYDEMKTMIQKGEMTLSTFSEMVGNVDGTLVEKSSYSNKYLWYKSSSNYLYGTFSTTSNKCTFVSGRRQ